MVLPRTTTPTSTTSASSSDHDREEPERHDNAEAEEKDPILIEYFRELQDHPVGCGIVYMPKNSPFSFTRLKAGIDELVNPTHESLEMFSSIRNALVHPAYQPLDLSSSTKPRPEPQQIYPGLKSVFGIWNTGGSKRSFYQETSVENQQEAERVFEMMARRGFKDHFGAIYEQVYRKG